MPELPDVEALREYFEKEALNRMITGVRAPDKRVIKNTSVQALSRRLKGEKFARTARMGKYFFAGRKEGEWLVMHFGMTGTLCSYSDNDEPPEYESVVFDFTGGKHLGYISQRKLGKVCWTEDVNKFAVEQGIGIDALSDQLTREKFVELLSGHSSFLKSELMNQAVIAGLGNIWADEMIFQAGLHPKAEINNLTEDDLRNLYKVMGRVLKTGIRNLKEGRNPPRNYLVNHRRSDGICPECGTGLGTVKVSGRTSYYCPKCQ